MLDDINYISALITEDPSRTIFDLIAEDDRGVQQAYKAGLQMAASTFGAVSKNPQGLYSHLLRGMRESNNLIAINSGYWSTMQSYWDYLEPSIFNNLKSRAKQNSDRLNQYYQKSMLTESTVSEGLEGIGKLLGFMGKLAIAIAATQYPSLNYFVHGGRGYGSTGYGGKVITDKKHATVVINGRVLSQFTIEAIQESAKAIKSKKP